MQIKSVIQAPNQLINLKKSIGTVSSVSEYKDIISDCLEKNINGFLFYNTERTLDNFIVSEIPKIIKENYPNRRSLFIGYCIDPYYELDSYKRVLQLYNDNLNFFFKNSRLTYIDTLILNLESLEKFEESFILMEILNLMFKTKELGKTLSVGIKIPEKMIDTVAEIFDMNRFDLVVLSGDKGSSEINQLLDLRKQLIFYENRSVNQWIQWKNKHDKKDLVSNKSEDFRKNVISNQIAYNFTIMSLTNNYQKLGYDGVVCDLMNQKILNNHSESKSYEEQLFMFDYLVDFKKLFNKK
ncbi:hypothetical protein [Enterococcus thailandicus]|uniref:hypothetical protein n=1 Tax=Enterococcus thailandicus TaxID=417368 RepID=UPI0022E02C4D|nr:hypothetical protein [Enterococcus thailandicus]